MAFAAAQRPAWPLVFLCIATAVYATALAIAGQLGHLEERRVLAIALTFDLVVVVPVAFYILVVRYHRLPAVTFVPIVVLSVLAASRILPDDQQQTLRVLEVLAAPMELGLIAWVGWRAARAVRKAGQAATAEPLERFRTAALELTRNDRAAAIIATEAGVFYYAIGSWRARPHTLPAMYAFTHHVRSGQAAIVLGFILVLIVEGLGVHLLLSSWSVVVAWIFSISTAYGALWLIADYRATVLRPILVSKEDLLIRAGLRCTIRVPLAGIAAVGHEKPDAGKESVNLTFLGTPTYWLTLSEPIVADGPYGFSRRVRAVGIAPDAPEAFDRLLREGSG